MTTENPNFNKQLFGDDFIWGVSVAAAQIEGAHNADGKGESIWDVFTRKKGKIHNNAHHHISCDFYNKYQEDIDLIKSLNIPNFRFSIAWSRVLPNGIGEQNEAGTQYYHRVIDYCLEQGITPWITLYHWDIPQALENKGGWTNRDVISWFTYFVDICAQEFGSKVKNWMIMNEPSVFTGAGYFFGLHAPGKTGLDNFLPAAHHAVLAIAAGARTLRKALPKANIGTTYSCSYIEPYSQKKSDINAAKRIDTLLNRVFIEPGLGLGYPIKDLPVLKRIEKYFQPGDENEMQFDFDFIGLQIYTREIVKYSFFTPYINAGLVSAKDRKVPATEMGWEVYPRSIYEIIKKYNQYKGIKKIYITENGAAFPDKIKDGQVHDPKRVQFLQNYLEQLLAAKKEGFNVSGYFVWTLTDNFEWAEGYKARFGLIYIDFDTQQRIVKSSGKWYRDFLSNQPYLKASSPVMSMPVISK